ncbi:MAG TPA: 1,4-alpha-glucan branching enzyme, partial [Streptomyces sp.]|nr:1,4-alpha-glucan branching enzyme [Streptomyces sp.]
MTVPQPPDRTGRVQPHVPATFLSGPANSESENARWGWPSAELTGLMAAPAGDAPTWTGPPVELPPEASSRTAGPQAAPLPHPGRTRLSVRQARRGRTAPPAAAHAEPDATPTPTPQGNSTARDRVRTPPVLPAEDRRRLLEGTHRDPHAHLGAHITADGGVCFRTLHPQAHAVTVIADGGELRAQMRDEGDGFFAVEVKVPGGEIPAHELCVQYGKLPGEDDVRILDPYGFPPSIGEFDLRLIGDGRHEHLWRALGARTMTHRGVTGTRFSVWAPDAEGVRVAGDFNCWDGTSRPMRSLGSSGVWELFLPGVGDGTAYKFEVTGADGSRALRPDPMARAAEAAPDGGSVVHTSMYRWRDGDWADRRSAGMPHAAPLSVYELHLPSWRPGLGCSELAAQLPAYVKDLGFTHVELMQCADHLAGGPGAGQVSGFFAPTAGLRGPDDFKYLIDALHCAGIGVIMGWAPPHFPMEEWAPARCEPGSPHEEPRSGTPGFGFGRREVRNFLVANAVYWCEEFHLDGLRLAAVASLVHSGNSPGDRTNPDAVAFLQEMNATLHHRCPGVITAAEETTAWDGVTRATHHVGENGFGGLGFTFKRNTAWTDGSLGYAAREP